MICWANSIRGDAPQQLTTHRLNYCETPTYKTCRPTVSYHTSIKGQCPPELQLHTTPTENPCSWNLCQRSESSCGCCQISHHLQAKLNQFSVLAETQECYDHWWASITTEKNSALLRRWVVLSAGWWCGQAAEPKCENVCLHCHVSRLWVMAVIVCPL